MMRVHREELVVAPKDLDQLEHVNNIRYVEWIQEISKNHWQRLADQTLRDGSIWVVRNHNISYLRQALLGDRLELTTYVEEFKGALSLRVVEIKNGTNGELLVRALTQWCLLDARNLRPKRVPESVRSLFD